MDIIAIWYNPNKNSYYWRRYSYSRYEVGDTNCYGHEIILIIDIFHEYRTPPLKKRLLRKLISFLEKFEKE